METMDYTFLSKVIQSDSNHILFSCPLQVSECKVTIYYVQFLSKQGELYDYKFYFPDVNQAYHFFNRYMSYHSAKWVSRLILKLPECSLNYVSTYLYNQCLLNNQLSLFDVPGVISAQMSR